MQNIEDISIIIQILIDKKKPIKLQDLLSDVAISKSDVLSVLKILSDLDILKKEYISEHDKNYLYSIKKDLNAIHLTRCSDYGIDLFSFNYFNINNKEKKAALEISTQIKKIQKITENKRKLFVHNKLINNLHFDDISSHLLLIYEATNNQLFEYLKNVSVKDNILKEMLLLHEQSFNTLKDYLESNKKI